MRTAASVGIIIAATLFGGSCSGTRHVTAKVQWSDEEGPNPSRLLPVGAVRFNFTSDQDQYFVVTDVPGLVDRLRASGTKTVRADFDVYCTWRGKVAGYSFRAVNGSAIRLLCLRAARSRKGTHQCRQFLMPPFPSWPWEYDDAVPQGVA